MARLDADHQRAAGKRPHANEPQHPAPTYVIDLEAGGAACAPDPENALDQFVSEFGEVSPGLPPPPHGAWVEPPAASPPAARHSSNWIDGKTMITVVITMMVTASGVAVGLRVTSDGPPAPAPFDSPPPEAVTPVRASAVAPAGVAVPDVPDPWNAFEPAPADPDPSPTLGRIDARAPAPAAPRAPVARDRDGDAGRPPLRDARPAPVRQADASSLPGALAARTANRPGGSSGTAAIGLASAVPPAAPPVSTAAAVVPTPLPPEPDGGTTLDLPSSVHTGEAVVRESATAAIATPGAPAGAEAPSAAAVAPGLIRQVLDRYQEAFSALDAGAAKVVWPSVDVGALERAFQGLQTQRVELQDCRIAVDETQAVAVCGGLLRYVPRVGRKSERVERRQFEFGLRRVDDVWAIDHVESR